MESEKFLTPSEFKALLKATNDDRERCILLLAGACLRVSEMTQIRAEDMIFRKEYLHVQASNVQFKKSRTVVLLHQIAEAASSSSLDALKAACSRAIVMATSLRVRSRMFLTA